MCLHNVVHELTLGVLFVELLQYLRVTEKEKGIKPDPAVDAYLKASAIQGKLFSPSTQYIMRLLGLEVRFNKHCLCFWPATH